MNKPIKFAATIVLFIRIVICSASTNAINPQAVSASQPNTNGVLFLNASALLKEYPEIVIKHVDEEADYLVITQNGSFNSSDTECQWAGQLYYKLCSLKDGNVILYVTDGPLSSVNPMDVIWAEELPIMGKTIRPDISIDEHKLRITNELKRRGKL